MTTPPAPPAANGFTPEVDAYIKRVAQEAAKQAVAEALGGLGIVITSPEHVREWHADQIWIRSAREGSSVINRSIKTSIIGAIITAISVAIWAAIQRPGG